MVKLGIFHVTSTPFYLFLTVKKLKFEPFLGIDRLEVDGNICSDGELAVHASLNNAYLEDTRPKKVFTS